MVILRNYEGLLRHSLLANVGGQVEVTRANDLVFRAKFQLVQVSLPLVFAQLEETCLNRESSFTLGERDFGSLVIHGSLLRLDGLLASMPLHMNLYRVCHSQVGCIDAHLDSHLPFLSTFYHLSVCFYDIESIIDIISSGALYSVG